MSAASWIADRVAAPVHATTTQSSSLSSTRGTVEPRDPALTELLCSFPSLSPSPFSAAAYIFFHPQIHRNRPFFILPICKHPPHLHEIIPVLWHRIILAAWSSLGMNFPFSHVCDLLDDLEKEGLGGPVSVQNWFKKHNGFFRNPRFNGRILLSILLPERRPDRVYGVQEATLSRIFARSQCLGRQSLARLHQWKDVGSKHDLADKIEEYLRDVSPPSDCVGCPLLLGLFGVCPGSRISVF